MLESLPKDPLFWLAVVASIIGLVVHYLYSGFIRENYKQIKWFRRLFLPHMTFFLEQADQELQEYDLSKFYVEGETSEKEKVLSVEVGRSEYEEVHDEIAQFLFSKHFRPEVLLASLGSTPDGYKEIGNYVLTGPEKKHVDVPVFGKLYDVMILLLSKWQLHVRVFYNSEEDQLKIFVHHEKNPYNPIEAKNHYVADEFNVMKGKRLFMYYLPELDRGPLKNRNYDVFYSND